MRLPTEALPETLPDLGGHEQMTGFHEGHGVEKKIMEAKTQAEVEQILASLVADRQQD
jgi:hypothetical protein